MPPACTTLPTLAILSLFVTSIGLMPQGAAEEAHAFGIRVIDDASGRGVPLVELETVHHLKFVTDSQGYVAVSEPDLMSRNVYFFVSSHGYEYPQDGFGFRGTALQVTPGGRATLKVRRVNLAERLYRITGSGLYADSLKLEESTPRGGSPPTAEIAGCDSVLTALYRGRVHWFWGDTLRLHYPIGGTFHTSGATSSLPSNGGLPIDQGVGLTYFTDKEGAIRPMAEMPGNGPTWISSLTVLKNSSGQEEMLASYVKIRNSLDSYRWGFVRWNDTSERFDHVAHFDRKPTIFLEPQTHTFLRSEQGKEYVYFCNPLPLVRVEATPAAFVDPNRYESLTCLTSGSTPDKPQVDRVDTRTARYSWRPGTPPLTQQDQINLVKGGVLQPDEQLIDLQDIETGRKVQGHYGSTYWNEFRKRWLLLCVEQGGESSYLGEVWLAEADLPTGPWRYARKILTHQKYSFYNPKQHPLFAESHGKVIYFEGTYTHTFSGNPQQTARYDYNQLMYRLDLSIPELNLPVACYRDDSLRSSPIAMGKPGRPIAFFALPMQSHDTVPIFWNGTRLVADQSPTDPATRSQSPPLFYAIPASAKSPPISTTPLYESLHKESGQYVYHTETEWPKPGYLRSAHPICRVWRGPLEVVVAEWHDGR